MGKFEKSEELEKLATKVISENEVFTHLNSDDCKIAFQVCESVKSNSGKTVYADTERVKNKLKVFLPYDFIITFYKDGIELSIEMKERLMYHELKHIGFEPEEKKYSIIPHDIEDFKDLIDKWGVDWIA